MSTISQRARVVQDMPACQHCGGFPTPKKGKPRSVPQHRRFFALIRASWMHWPERHHFKPQSEEHLRRWLTAKAGHREIDVIETAGMTPAQSVACIAAAMKRAGPYAFVSAVGTTLNVVTSKSINFDELPHLAACALFDAVAEIIEAETGIRCDDMITHTPRKSAREPMVTA